MNESALLRRLLPLLALLVAACGADPGPPPLEGATIGGPFALTSHEGRRVSERDFAGRYRIVYFGFTFCPDVCPTDLQTLAAGLRRFEESDPGRAERVQPIFITVDPARDTPEVLGRYVAAFHPRLIGLTGTPDEISSVARTFAVYFERGEPDARGDYQVNHSSNAVLFDGEGRPIAMLPTDQGAAAVAAELDRWVR